MPIAWRFLLRVLVYCPGLHDVPQQRQHALELVIQGGQACRRVAWGLAAFPGHGRFVLDRTHDGKEKVGRNREDLPSLYW